MHIGDHRNFQGHTCVNRQVFLKYIHAEESQENVEQHEHLSCLLQLFVKTMISGKELCLLCTCFIVAAVCEISANRSDFNKVEVVSGCYKMSPTYYEKTISMCARRHVYFASACNEMCEMTNYSARFCFLFQVWVR